jgi:hypothetical protein
VFSDAFHGRFRLFSGLENTRWETLLKLPRNHQETVSENSFQWLVKPLEIQW